MNEGEFIPGVLMTSKTPWLRWIMHGIGGGGAVAVGLAVIKAVENRPEFLPQLLGGNAPLFTALLLAMFFANQRFSQFTELQTRNVEANEKLAAGVNALVMKDDQKAREQEILLDHLAKQTEKILAHLERR